MGIGRRNALALAALAALVSVPASVALPSPPLAGGVAAVHEARAPGVYHGLDVTIVTTDFGVRR